MKQKAKTKFNIHFSPISLPSAGIAISYQQSAVSLKQKAKTKFNIHFSPEYSLPSAGIAISYQRSAVSLKQ